MPSWKPWYGHSIGHNAKSRRPSLFCFVDTESRKRTRNTNQPYTENELRLGVACFVEWRKGREPKEKWVQFDKADDFWHKVWQMLHRRRVRWLIAHNSIFDFTLLELWSRLENNQLFTSTRQAIDCHGGKMAGLAGPNWKGLVAIDSIPFHMELLHERGRLNISDLMNYYPVKLSEIGKSIGIPKLPMPDDADSTDVWTDYCRNDVQILKTAYLNLVRQWESEDNGNWKMSAASLAWNNYRHTRDCTDIIVHQHSDARELEWKAYYGGECRAWFRGSVPVGVVHLDVNSLYPSVMREGLFPTELIDYILTPHLPIVESIAKRAAIVADVTMENVFDDVPVRSNGRVVYPVGWFRTQLAGPEFSECLAGDCIRQIHAIAYYRQSNIFKDYVDRWYESKSNSRSAGDRAGDTFAKLMLNSLQGKFVQRRRVWETNDEVEVLDPWKVGFHRNKMDGKAIFARAIGWTGQSFTRKVDCSHTFPAIAAYITSYARQKMRQIRRDIPPTCLYYQDTDSLMVDRTWYDTEGKQVLLIGDGLGQLRVIGVYGNVTIRGRKNYTVDGRDCISGMSVKDVKIGDTTYVGERFERAASIVSRNPDGIVRAGEREFSFPGVCQEGAYDRNGWAIPVVLGLTEKPRPVILNI
jgi:hypothetical protein